MPTFDAATRAVAVRHRDELLGALTLHKPRNEPVSAAEGKLLANLASQAALVLRNVRLTAELQASIDDLRASRRRLVRAQHEERHRIERNLHDGAQRQLVALTVRLTLLEDAADPAEVRQMTGQLRSGLYVAIDDLRALARGIYPPLLADQGAAAGAPSTSAPRPGSAPPPSAARCPWPSRPRPGASCMSSSQGTLHLPGRQPMSKEQFLREFGAADGVAGPPY